MIERADNIQPTENGLVIQGLALLPPGTLIDEAGLADLFRCSTRTIRAMAARFDLPAPIQIAGRSMWFAGRLLAYLDRSAERAEQDGIAKARRLGRNIT